MGLQGPTIEDRISSTPSHILPSTNLSGIDVVKQKRINDSIVSEEDYHLVRTLAQDTHGDVIIEAVLSGAITASSAGSIQYMH